MAEDEKILLLKLHRCVKGLSDEAIGDIAGQMELVRYEAGEIIHHAKDTLTSVFVIVQGRLKVSALDLHGNEFLQRFLVRGDQFGGLGAALGEPIPVNVYASEPSTVLKLDYQVAIELTKRHAQFRSNFSRLIAAGVQQAFFNVKRREKPLVVAFLHQSPATVDLTRRVIERLVELGENVCVMTDRPSFSRVDGVRHWRLVEKDRSPGDDEFRGQIQSWAKADRIVIDVDAHGTAIETVRVLEYCEHAFWCIRVDDREGAAERLKSIDVGRSGWHEKISIVWLLDGDQAVIPLAPGLKEVAKEDLKISFAEPGANQGRALVNGFQRLIQRLRGIRIGLALGGGAARGMAHLGVLKVLEQSGIVVDMIAGTSAGAMTGTLIAAGLECDHCTGGFAADLRPSWLFRRMPHGDQWYLLYKYRRGLFDPMLRKYLSDWHLEQLPIPMLSVSVDLVSGEAVVRDRGDAVHAILESINLPVLSLPICRDGRVLVDGGLIDNVPADVLVSRGCNFVIAVSVTARMEHRFGNNHPGMATNEMKTPSTLQTILRSYLVQSMNMNSIGVQPADVVIEPDVTAFELTEFTRAEELAAIGAQATLEAIPRIKTLLKQFDSKLFG